MSILDGGFLVGGDTPTPTPIPTPIPTPETPIETPRTVKGQHVATLGISGTFTGYEQFGGWDLINPVQTWERFEHENYLGTHHADPVIISGTHQVGHFFYRTSGQPVERYLPKWRFSMGRLELARGYRC